MLSKAEGGSNAPYPENNKLVRARRALGGFALAVEQQIITGKPKTELPVKEMDELLAELVNYPHLLLAFDLNHEGSVNCQFIVTVENIDDISRRTEQKAQRSPSDRQSIVSGVSQLLKSDNPVIVGALTHAGRDNPQFLLVKTRPDILNELTKVTLPASETQSVPVSASPQPQKKGFLRRLFLTKNEEWKNPMYQDAVNQIAFVINKVFEKNCLGKERIDEVLKLTSPEKMKDAVNLIKTMINSPELGYFILVDQEDDGRLMVKLGYSKIKPEIKEFPDKFHEQPDSSLDRILFSLIEGIEALTINKLFPDYALYSEIKLLSTGDGSGSKYRQFTSTIYTMQTIRDALLQASQQKYKIMWFTAEINPPSKEQSKALSAEGDDFSPNDEA